jgi:hypothetical protein
MNQDHWTLTVAAITLVLATGRFSRLLIFDDFPPAIWLREGWFAFWGENATGKLLACPWCLTPWLVLVNLTWAYLSDLAWWWWAPNLWFALSYAASIVIAYDEPE